MFDQVVRDLLTLNHGNVTGLKCRKHTKEAWYIHLNTLNPYKRDILQSVIDEVENVFLGCKEKTKDAQTLQ